jgi:hypothetical protein
LSRRDVIRPHTGLDYMISSKADVAALSPGRGVVSLDGIGGQPRLEKAGSSQRLAQAGGSQRLEVLCL